MSIEDSSRTATNIEVDVVDVRVVASIKKRIFLEKW
jgi:hypothetical protein